MPVGIMRCRKENKHMFYLCNVQCNRRKVKSLGLTLTAVKTILDIVCGS